MNALNCFEDLKGRTIVTIEQYDDELHMTLSCGTKCMLYHEQDCCEHVYIEDIVGHLDDIIGHPLTMAEESTNRDDGKDDESFTWTFYRFATVRGYVTVRFYGTSNGYYSERVDFTVL